jgi:hypothetical protein
MTHLKHREQLDVYARSHQGSAIAVVGDNWDLCLRTTDKVDADSPLGQRLNKLMLDFVQAVHAEMPKRIGQAAWVEPNSIRDLTKSCGPTIAAVNMGVADSR